MEYTKVDPKESYILRLYRGENVHEAITAFCVEKGIKTGWFTALGAIEDTDLGYYSLEDRSYAWKTYKNPHEVVTMIGNVALVDDVPFLHIHSTISNDENEAIGGHLKSAVVAVTLEVHLTAFEEQLERVFDEVTGLKLIGCPHVLNN